MLENLFSMQAKNLFLASKQTKKTILPQSGLDGDSLRSKNVKRKWSRNSAFGAFASLMNAVGIWLLWMCIDISANYML